MNVTLVDSMGTDLSVVNAARVSFAKNLNGDIMFLLRVSMSLKRVTRN